MSDSPAPSPRRPFFAASGAPGAPETSPRPQRTAGHASVPFPGAEVASGSRPPPINTSVRHGLLSPQLSTPVDQVSGGQLQYPMPDMSPRPSLSSPRGPGAELPPRSRRNSAAIVSISLSTRSRSRTPRGSHAALHGSGTLTPSRTSNLTPKLEDAVLVQMGGEAGKEEPDDWQPNGGMLLGDDDDSAIAEDDQERSWTGITEAGETPSDIMRPGMLFGEGLQFQNETIEPAVGKDADGNGILPLRRDGSGMGQKRRPGVVADPKMIYEVIRYLGRGSYAVVYLVREKRGRKREYVLSKQNYTPQQTETQLFEATIHLSLPIHQNIVTLHQTLQTRSWLFLMLECCPGEDLFYWLEKHRDASPPPVNARLPLEPSSSSKLSSSAIPFSSSQLFGGISHMSMAMSNSQTSSPFLSGQSPASLLFSHHNGNGHPSSFAAQTPPTPSLLSAFAANTLLSPRRLRLIASMFSQMCEAVQVCHDAGVSHRDIKPENFICCDSVELESVAEAEGDFGPQAKRKVIVKLTDFGLSTTDEESGDVECGSKPYMAFECRNNLGPTYMPALADVWSLGVVLMNMVFHRNPWKDPIEGDLNFDNYLHDPVGYLLSKFNGIGKEVATYIAEHVLCLDVENRVTAGQLGKWAKNLPEMITGKKAILQIKTEGRERKERERVHKWEEATAAAVQSGMFTKSPVVPTERKVSASALTSTAPSAITVAASNTTSSTVSSNTPTLSASIRPPVIAHEEADDIAIPELDDELTSATTVDEQATPQDSNTMYSPDQSERGDNDDARSISTNKRRKRGVRKGKAAQAALAAAAAGDAPTKEQRDALLAELATASQSLARDLSKGPKKEDLDFNRIEDFPPLGTSPAAIAQAKKSRWKNLMKASEGPSANPELAALRRRVAERDAGSDGNWSAPAKLQGHPDSKRSPFRGNVSATSAYSSLGQVSSTSATSSMSGAEDDDWRKRPAKLETHKEEDAESEQRGRREKRREARRDESLDRARRAAAAAAAITGGMEGMTMGAFGKPLPGPLARPMPSVTPSVPIKQTHYAFGNTGPVGGSRPTPASGLSSSRPIQGSGSASTDLTRPSLVSLSTAPASMLHTVHSGSTFSPSSEIAHQSQQLGHSRESTASIESSRTILAPDPQQAQAGGKPEEGPNKPKLKGQISSLRSMLTSFKKKE